MFAPIEDKYVIPGIGRHADCFDESPVGRQLFPMGDRREHELALANTTHQPAPLAWAIKSVRTPSDWAHVAIWFQVFSSSSIPRAVRSARMRRSTSPGTRISAVGETFSELFTKSTKRFTSCRKESCT